MFLVGESYSIECDTLLGLFCEDFIFVLLFLSLSSAGGKIDQS